MTPTQLASQAWLAYMDALAVFAALRGTQFDLFALGDVSARVKFWRETWLACEREAVRVG